MPALLSSVVGFVRREWVLLIVLAFALGYSLYQLTDVPPTWYDEGMIVQLSMNLVRHGALETQVAPGTFVSGAYTTTGFPVSIPVAASFALFGTTLASARGVMVVFIFSFLLSAYFLMKRFAGRSPTLWSLALLATFSSFYATGKNVLGEVPGLFFLFLFLLYAHAVFDEAKPTQKNILLAGLFFGLCIATKPTFLVLGGAVLIALVYVYFSRGWSALPIFLIPWGIGAALLPILFWLGTQFNLHDNFSRIFAFYANPYRLTSIPLVMVHNFLRFFTEATPLYLLGMLTVWGVAILIRIVKRERLSFIEVTAVSFVALILLAYLRTPGWYRYLFTAQIVAMLFFPVSLLYCAKNFPIQRLKNLALQCAPILLTLLIVMQIYVLFFTSWVSGYGASQRDILLKNYFRTWDPAMSVLVYDNPQVPLFLPPATPYYQYIAVNGHGYWGVGEDAVLGIQQKIPDAIVVSSDTIEGTTTFTGYSEKDTVAGLSILTRTKTSR